MPGRSKVLKFQPLVYLVRFRRAFQIWQSRDGSFLAAAIAFYCALSIIPFFAVAIEIINTISEKTDYGRDAHEVVMLAVENETSPEIRQALEDILSESRSRSKIEGPLTLAWLFLMSLIVFSRVDRAFERIWLGGRTNADNFLHAAKRVLKNRARATVLFIGYGLAMISIFVFTLVAQSIEHYSGVGIFAGDWFSWVTHSVVAILLNSLLFLLLFMWLSREKVRWRDALHGSVLLAVSWEIGRQLMALAIIGNQQSLYGVLGSFMAILLWTYYASALVLYWGAFVKCLHEDFLLRKASQA
jgi:membrane protein